MPINWNPWLLRFLIGFLAKSLCYLCFQTVHLIVRVAPAFPSLSSHWKSRDFKSICFYKFQLIYLVHPIRLLPKNYHPIFSWLAFSVQAPSISSTPSILSPPLFLSFNKLPQTWIDFLLSEGDRASDLFHYHGLIIPIEMSLLKVCCAALCLHAPQIVMSIQCFTNSLTPFLCSAPPHYPIAQPPRPQHVNNQLVRP